MPHSLARLLALLALAASAGAAPVSFRRDIAPLLQRRCVACHGEEAAKSGYRVDSFQRLARAGDSELPALVPGQPEHSELYRLLIENDPHDRMPQRAEALPERDITLIKRWIAEGAINDGGPADRPLVEVVRETLLRPAPETYPRSIAITALAFGPRGHLLAAAGYYEITIWDPASGRLVRRIGGLPERITGIAWNTRRDLLAVAGGSPGQWGSVWLIEPAQHWRPRLLCDLAETALSVAFHPEGTMLLATAADRTIRQFDPGSGRQQRVWKAHADWVQTVCFNAAGDQFLSASRDRTARLYDTASGDPLTRYDGHAAPILAAVFPAQGNRALTAARGEVVQQWELRSGTRVNDWSTVGRDVQLLLPLESNVLAAGSLGSLRLVQPSDGSVLLTFHGHRDSIGALALAPDRRTFASGDHAGDICIWNPGCETPVARFRATP